jgi:2-polyprenyl-3-methyl-5-hydroxy-6-metoxy-1,4-benzoquinol methylase
MAKEPWQIQVFKKSIKKKEKLRLIQKHLPSETSRSALDLGCAQGILSHFLRAKGGFWVSTDQDFANLKTTQTLVPDNLVQTEPSQMPFKENSFDLVVCLDYLEHLEDDRQCLREISRILKPGSELVMVTPHTGKIFLLHRLRALLGLKLEYYGHKREGYSLEDLRAELDEAGLRILRHKTYSRFFSEFLELLINLVYLKFLRRERPTILRDGSIRPSTAAEFEAQRKNLKVYSFLYPFVWASSRLDKLLFFLKGYSLIIWARKRGA